MENLNRLIDWAKRNRDSLKIRFLNATYISTWLPGFFDITVQASIGGRTICGRSVRPLQEEALLRAFMELFERIVFYGESRTEISGFAAHTSEFNSFQSSSLEIIERDAVLFNHLNGKPFLSISLDLYDLLGPIAKALLAQSASKGITWSFHAAESFYQDVFVVVCRAYTDNADESRQIFGFGSGFSLKDTVQKSLFECIQNVPTLIQPIGQYTNLISFQQSKSWTPKDHCFLGLDPSYMLQISNLFPACNISLPASENSRRMFSFKDFQCRPLVLPDSIKELLDLVFVTQSTNPLLQKLFTGPTEISKINKQRFQNKNLNEINYVPHFIG